MTQDGKKQSGTTKQGRSHDYERLDFTERQQNIQEIMHQGQEAARLMNSPVYVLAYRSSLKEIQDEWMMTLPEEKAKRDGLYMEIQALSRVQRNLAEMVSAAQTINAEMQKEEETAQRESGEFLTLEEMGLGLQQPDPM